MQSIKVGYCISTTDICKGLSFSIAGKVPELIVPQGPDPQYLYDLFFHWPLSSLLIISVSSLFQDAVAPGSWLVLSAWNVLTTDNSH